MTNENTNERFRVEIFSFKTGETEAIIGTNMTEEKAEKRIMTGLTRIDLENYGVRSVKQDE